mmetsp:Transcript_31185/g.65755  ORF Transcript_31185/g.65755 Transcript_31185/m.65755 type:complete len:92 (-) Transcript_31185:191-466(-)|eukprot:CAMPEP_0172310300 /NCGR_PEP_ID=MMETSP1058-20130122/11408_1 /TAXON_ID=83371 /ORGANISM="Detonula confervacea, Strain CCMP 353" /LENGTH=91 /DNA_ID=CAMNT_0013023093 /DNA_START=462 /DNA_END=737 /DNA_ORIENTATION=-
MAKRILTLIIRRTNRLLSPNSIHNTRRTGNVTHFHHGIVQAVVCREEISVTCQEDEEEEFVGAEGDSGGVFGDAEAEEEDDDGDYVAHVAA